MMQGVRCGGNTPKTGGEEALDTPRRPAPMCTSQQQQGQAACLACADYETPKYKVLGMARSRAALLHQCAHPCTAASITPPQGRLKQRVRSGVVRAAARQVTKAQPSSLLRCARCTQQAVTAQCPQRACQLCG